MSYEVIYDKQFIKAEKNGEDVFIPMLYGGSNNCIQFDRSSRGRRERSWFVLTYILKGRQFGTLAEMVKNAEDERLRIIARNEESNERYKVEGNESWCDKYSDEKFGYFTSLAIGGHTSNTSFGKYKGLFVTGCKKALTVEQLLELRVSVTIYTSIYSNESLAEFKAMGKEEFRIYPQTSAELIEKIEWAEEYLKDTKVSFYIRIDADERQMKNIRAKMFPKTKKKELVSLDKFYVVSDSNTRAYLIKLTGRGYSYSHYGRSMAKRFATIKQAEKFAKKANDKFRDEDRFVVELVNETAQVYV